MRPVCLECGVGVSVRREVQQADKGLTSQSPWTYHLIQSLLGSLCSMKPLGTGSTSSQLNNLNLGWAKEKLEFTRPLQNQNTSQPTNQQTMSSPLPKKPTQNQRNMWFKKQEKKKTIKVWRRFHFYKLIFFFNEKKYFANACFPHSRVSHIK